MSVLDLTEADSQMAGGKAAPLAKLMGAGFNVPDGFVVPTTTFHTASAALGLNDLSTDDPEHARTRILNSALPPKVVDDITQALKRIAADAPTDYVAVRSSAVAEDNADASAAGQYDSFLAVRGPEQVCKAILKCWASLWTERPRIYRTRYPAPNPELADMAVLVQVFVDADISGIMFTGATSTIEASWGIGERIVAGHITPDAWRVADRGIIGRRPGLKTERTDRNDSHLVTQSILPAAQEEPCLTDSEIMELHALGNRVSAALGGPRDIEWAMTHDTTWILQARPVTAVIPDPVAAPHPPLDGTSLTGEPASSGTASGPVRIVRGPGDFSKVVPGDVLVCRHTDPAWTPLFAIASAVVTETGGVLSHAAIVAREVGIPAVLAVPQATEVLTAASTVTVNGDLGYITATES